MSQLAKNLTLDVTVNPLDYEALGSILNRTFGSIIGRLPVDILDYERLQRIVDEAPLNSVDFWKDVINYFIEHDYNITQKVYGQPGSVKRFSIVGYLEEVLVKVAHQVLGAFKALLHDIIEPIIIKIINTVVSLAAEIVVALIHILRTLWNELTASIAANPNLVDQIVRFLKWLAHIISNAAHVLLEHLIELNREYKVIELAILFIMCVRYLRGYIISGCIVATAGYYIGYDRVTEHTVIVILIVTFSLLHFFFPPEHYGYY